MSNIIRSDDFASRSAFNQDDLDFMHGNTGISQEALELSLGGNTGVIFEATELLLDRTPKLTPNSKSKESPNDLPPRSHTKRRVYKTSREEGDRPSSNKAPFMLGGQAFHLPEAPVVAPAKPQLDHDTMFNFIPAACLETAISVEVLNNPGQAGRDIDAAALKLATLIDHCYANGNLPVFDSNGGSKPLSEALNKGILHELRPNGTQIGRCLANNDGSQWLSGEGLNWLLQELRTPEGGRDSLLTKVRAISAFGKFVYDNMKANKPLMCKLLDKNEEEVTQRFDNFVQKIRHSGFSNSDVRLRSEKPPIVNIDGRLQPITVLNPQPPRFLNVPGASSGFTYTKDSFNPDQQAVAAEVNRDLARLTAEGIPRQNAVITNPARVGILTDCAMKNIPPAFVEAGLLDLLKENEMFHGNGMNRWTQQGSFIRELLAKDLPIAGSNSGSASDILLGLDFLSETTIFGNQPYVSRAGVIIASWMNFGGYHAVPEAYLIAKAVANNETFEVLGPNTSVSRETAQGFYQDFVQVVNNETDAGDRVEPYVAAYQESCQQ